MKIEIKHRFTGQIILSGEYESIKDCLQKNRGADLRGADLGGAYLRGADLGGAYLGGAYLGGADLRGVYLRDAEGYQNSHAIFAEAVRRQPITWFTDIEWSAIGEITIYSLCWDTIKKRFSGIIPHVFEILANAGFIEWLKYWNTIQD